MKRLLLLLLLSSFAASVGRADEILRHWQQNAGFTYYNSPGIRYQFAHFYPDKPCFIKSVKLWVYSPNGGSADVFILGHQAGDFLPETFYATGKTLASAKITIPGKPNTAQSITVNLEEPIYTANDQFFVGVSNLQNAFLLSDTVKKDPYCNGNPEAGGVFGYQSLLGINDQNEMQWSIGGLAYAIDVTVNYPQYSSPKWLENQTASLGLNEFLNNKSIAAGDINRDGFIDLLIDGKLFINNNGEEYKDAKFLWNYDAGLNVMGNAFVDADNDGDLDILIIYDNNANHQKHKLYVYDGDKTLTPKELSIPEVKGLSSFNFGDLNNDGYLDLFIGQLWSYYGDEGPDLLPNYVLLSSGSATNPDWILQPLVCNTNPARRSRGSQMIDYDNDGDLDIYVVNYYLEADELWENKGNMSFVDVIAQKHIDENTYNGQLGHNHGTGVDWYDYDNDGDFDLLLSQFAHPRFLAFDHRGTTIYNNAGAPAYDFFDTYDKDKKASKLGIEYEETHAGAAFGDVNNDALADIITTTFYDCRYIDLFTQKPDHTFDNKTWEYGLDNIVTGEDAIWLDFNNDGRLDLAAGNKGQFRLYKNMMVKKTNYSEIDLAPSSGNKFGIGSRVVLYSGNNVQTQMVGSGRGVRMQKPSRLHYGLADDEFIKKIEVYWNGAPTPETFYNIEPNKVVTLKQGEATAPQKPAAPALLSPANNAQNQPKEITLSWQKSLTAMSYKLEIAKDENFTNVVDTKTLPPTVLSYGAKLEYDTQYWWRVVAYYYDVASDYNAFTFKTVKETSAQDAPIGGALEILSVYPTPAAGQTTISIFAPKAGAASVSIVDATGKVISSAFVGSLSEGINKINWNASALASGVYYLKLEQGPDSFVKQIVIKK